MGALLAPKQHIEDRGHVSRPRLGFVTQFQKPGTEKNILTVMDFESCYERI